MKICKIMHEIISILIIILFSNLKLSAQYTMNNNRMNTLSAIDSFYIKYSIGIIKDSILTEIDTVTLARYDSTYSFSGKSLNVLTNGYHSMVVQHKAKRIVFGPKAPKFMDQYIKIDLKDTNRISSIDSTDTIAGYRIYTIKYDSCEKRPFRSKIIKLNTQTGFADSIILIEVDVLKNHITTIFNLITLQTSGNIIQPTYFDKFLMILGPPASWLKKPDYSLYQLINYYK